MYKVFVNEKELFLSKLASNAEKIVPYQGKETFEMAIDLLQNTSCTSVNIFFEDIDVLWQEFRKDTPTIEAAGGLVKNKDEEILFIKRLGRWDLPKGKIEKNEGIPEAALREVMEETGITILEIGEFLTPTYHIYMDRNSKNILKITHWFAMSTEANETLIPQAEEGITEVCWLSKAKIRQEVYSSTFQNINLLLQQFS